MAADDATETEYALVLSGGNALGAYQAGAYQALHEAGIRPRWIAGTSVGAVNAALIAGNAPERRVARLRDYWETAAGPDGAWPLSLPMPLPLPLRSNVRRAGDLWNAVSTILFGRPGLFPARWSDLLPGGPASPAGSGRYDRTPLADALARLIDFDRLNAGELRVIVNATDASTGAEIVFDGRREAIGLRHVLASMALPGDFAPVEIDGRWLYDGSLSANVAVEALLREPPRGDLVCIVVDLFDRHAKPPTDLAGALRRRQDLPFAAQTCRAYENLRRAYASRATGASVLIVDLVRRDSPDEPATKMYDYSRTRLRERWAAGRADMARCLARLAAAPPPERRQGLRWLSAPGDDRRDSHAPAARIGISP